MKPIKSISHIIDNIAKSQYLLYGLFIVGIILIFVWAYVSGRMCEGFSNKEEAFTATPASAYRLNMYHVEWCPHCHAAKPEFDKLGSTMTIGDKQVVLEAIDAEKNPEKVLDKVSGYPTVRLYDSEGKLVEEYEGERSEAGFRAFLQQNVK